MEPLSSRKSPPRNDVRSDIPLEGVNPVPAASHTMADKSVKCRFCNGDHWGLKCPYKDTGHVPNKAVTTAIDDKKPPGGPADDNTMADKTVKCRFCNGDHWALKCPYKDTGYVPNKAVTPAIDDKKPPGGPADDNTKPPEYVPPYMREGARKRGDFTVPRHRDGSFSIRLSNLSESTLRGDLEELVKPFGVISKLFLGQDRNTGLCKGFAYIHFKSGKAAANAIASLNGHEFNHLILVAEWSQPRVQQH